MQREDGALNESWTWQFQNALQTQEDFERTFTLTNSEKSAFQQGKDVFSVRTTPYYASLARDIENDPIRRMMIPTELELRSGQQSMLDPLGEKKNNPVPRIIHRYPDRALLLVTDTCSVYCRYCTRKHFTGQSQAMVKKDEFEKALTYIRTHTEIREIILSGGDPLSLSDVQLDFILGELRKIKHIDIIRIGTRMPVVCPMRITHDLVKVIQKYHPVFVLTHFNHPREVSTRAKDALELLVNHGIPVLNHMVLLNGVNNHSAIVEALSRKLLKCRVKPYYMFQCDPSEGSDHFRTSIEESQEIQRTLWGRISGLALPALSLDIPNGGGKVGLVPDFEVERDQEGRVYRGWDGIEGKYLNPPVNNRLVPNDYLEYLNIENSFE